MTLREGPSKSRWTWRARLVLLFVLAVPVLAALWTALIFGIGEYARLRFFLDYSNELSVGGAVTIAIVTFVCIFIIMVIWAIERLVPFFRHYRLTIKRFCHIPRSEMRELWKDYER